MAGDVITTLRRRQTWPTRATWSAGWPTPRVGEAVPVVVLRDGKTETLTVTLGRREEAEAEADSRRRRPAPGEPEAQELLGLTVTPLTAERREQLGLPAGPKGWW